MVNSSLVRRTNATRIFNLLDSSLALRSPSEEMQVAKNRMTFEKQQRDAKKKRKADEKRAAKRIKKEAPETEAVPQDEAPEGDEVVAE